MLEYLDTGCLLFRREKELNRALKIAIMFFLCMLTLLTLLLNVGAGQSTKDSWPMFRHDPAHNGSSTSTVPSTNQTLWIQKTSGQVWSSPVVANGVVYVCSFDHNI
jgi:hypothetical protein